MFRHVVCSSSESVLLSFQKQTCTDVVPMFADMSVIRSLHMFIGDHLTIFCVGKFPFKLVGGRVPLCVRRVGFFF